MEFINNSILYRVRKQNTIVDFISRMQNMNTKIPMEDTFPNQHILTKSTKSP